MSARPRRPPLPVPDLLARYPLRVIYPHAGPHVFLVYYREWDGHRAIVARDEARLARAWGAVLRKGGFVEDRVFWRANVVAPPRALREAWAAASYFSEREDLAHWLAGLLHVYRQGRPPGAAPPGTVACSRYARRPGHGRADAYDREAHRYCQNCDGVALVSEGGSSLVELIADRGDEVRAYEERAGRRPSRGTVVTSPEPDPSLPVLGLMVDGGGRNGGLGVRPIEGDDFSTPILFFQGAREDVPSVVLDVEEDVRRRVRAADDAKRSARLAEEAWRRAEHERVLLAALSGEPLIPR